MRTALAIVVLLACVLRVALNDVSAFSDADETHYLRTARALAPSVLENYPRLAAEYVREPTAWPFPSLVRWGSHGLSALACRAHDPCTYRTLTWISTVAGMAVVVLAWAVGRARLGPRAALLGAAFVAISPLQLALGRRALQDELVCACVLATLWAALRVFDAPAGRPLFGRYAVAIAAAALALATKETSLLYAPALFALWLLTRARRGGGRLADVALFVAPPLVHYAGYSLLTRTATQFFDMARIGVSSLGFEYARQYQSGPPQRYLADLVLLAPAPFLLALAAVTLILTTQGEDRRGPRELAVFTLVALASFSLVSKNVRFIAAVEALLSLLAAWLVVTLADRARRPALAIAAAGLVVLASNAWVFDAVFLRGGVEDPTTYEVMRALDAVPR